MYTLKTIKKYLYKALFFGVLFSTITACNNGPQNNSGGGGAYEPANAPGWPLPYTEEDNSLNKVPISTKKDAPSQKSTWSGGADLTPPGGMPPVTEGRVPPDESRMPLANKDLGKDDGSKTIAASNPPGYPKLKAKKTGKKATASSKAKPAFAENQVRDWVAKEGLTLREVLEEWAAIEGWKVEWATHREYPLKAGVIFRGRFTDVTSAIIRTFAIAAPPPYAKFYFGNKTLVVKTLEDENAE